MFGIGGGSRDEEAIVTILRWLGQIMMNFTIGLISALVSFCLALGALQIGLTHDSKICHNNARILLHH